MKKDDGFVKAYWPLMTSVALAAGVYFLWLLHYPHLLLAREQSQLFLCNKEYFCERLAEPGGMARYLGEGIVQFFIFPHYGSLCYAILFLVIVWLTWRLFHKFKERKNWRYLLSLLPALLLCYFWTDPKIPMTLTMAVLVSLIVMNLIMPLSPKSSLVATAVAIPVGYWLVGPAIVLIALYHLRWLCQEEKTHRRGLCLMGTVATVLLLVASTLTSSWFVPHPVRKLFSGLDYYWYSERSKNGDTSKLPDKIGTIEEMAYDRLLRQQNWAGIISKAIKQPPTSLAVQNEVLYAQFRQGQIDQQEMLMRMKFDKQVLNTEVAAFILSDIYFQIGFFPQQKICFVNLAQRAAFEAMEAIPNYGKSGRSLQRLVETNIITGNYEVAQKYLDILDETLFYRKWSKKMRTLVENPQRIKEYPFYQQLQKSFAEGNDTFFY